MVGGWWRVASSGAGRLGRGASEFAVLENSYLAELILHDFSDCKLFFKSKLEGRIDFEQTKRPGRAPTAHGDVNRRAHAFRCPSLDPLADAFLFSRRCRYLRKKPSPPQGRPFAGGYKGWGGQGLGEWHVSLFVRFLCEIVHSFCFPLRQE